VPEDDLVLHVLDGTKDLSKYKHSLTNTGGVIAGKEMDFNGSNSISGAGTELSNVAAFTANMFVKINTIADFKFFMYKVSSATNRILFGLGGAGAGSNLRVYGGIYNGTNNFGYNDTNVIQTGRWQMFTMVYDGSKTGTNSEALKFYLDGQQLTLTFAGTIPATTPVNTTAIYLGGTSTNYLDGSIKDAKIFNTAKSAGWVKQEYDRTKKYY